MSAAAAPTVGKAALAQTLGWSRPKLDRRLETDPAFPVASRGDQSGGWKFDPAAVKKYLGVLPAEPAKGKAGKTPAATIDRAQLRDTIKPATIAPPLPPRRSAHHQGEATARQRKDLADAALRENKLRLENGELIELSDLRQRVNDFFAGMAGEFDGMPEAILKAFELGDDQLGKAQELVDRLRTRFVAAGENILPDE